MFSIMKLCCRPRQTGFYSNFDDDIPLETITLVDWEKMIVTEFRNLEKRYSIKPICKTTLCTFLKDVYEHYDSNIPYHNQNHIFEVFQFGMCMLHRHRNLIRNAKRKDIMTFCFALLLHDVGHLGYTNDQLESNCIELDVEYISDSSESSYASSYNEQIHCNIGIQLLQKNKLSFNNHLFNKLIFNTDMKHHDSFILKYNPFYGNQCEDTEHYNVFKFFIKLADIGHIIRPWEVHLNNVIRLNKERVCPLSTSELATDTLFFNKRYVLPLIHKMKDVNIGLYFKLNALYNDNMNRWICIESFFENLK